LAAVLAAPLASEKLGVLDVDDMRIVLLCSAAILSLQTNQRVFNALGVGLRRMVPPNVTNVIASFINFAFSVGALLMSTSLVNYAIANVVADVLGLLVGYIGLRIVWPGRLLRWPARQRMREMFAYGIKTQAHFVSFLVNVQTDKVVIALAVDVRAAGAFELAARVVQSVKAVGYLAVSALTPTATAEITTHGRHVIGPMYRRYTKLATSIASPIFIVTCLTSPALLVAWLGEVPPQTPLIVVLLSLAWFVNAANEVGMNLAAADGRPGAMAANTAAMAAMHIVFAAILTPLFGLWGVVAAAAASILIATVLFIQRFHGYYRLPVSDFTAAAFPPAAVALLIGVALAPIYLLVGLDPEGRTDALLILAPLGMAYVLAYWVVASYLRLLPSRLTLRLGRGPRTEADAVPSS
jgi:O-antigen/teichoic acid export membrane protein